jgi:transposase-like protein
MASASRFTPANRTAIVTHIGAGASLEQACEAAGISNNTVRRWVKAGAAAPDGPYGQFRRDVERARAAAHALAPPSEAAMTPEEFRACVEAGVRKGQVSAMSLYAAHFLKPPEEPKPLTAIGRLAAAPNLPKDPAA